MAEYRSSGIGLNDHEQPLQSLVSEPFQFNKLSSENLHRNDSNEALTQVITGTKGLANTHSDTSYKVSENDEFSINELSIDELAIKELGHEDLRNNESSNNELSNIGSSNATPKDYDSWQQQIESEVLAEWRRLSGLPQHSHRLRWPVSQYQPTQGCQQAVSWQPHQTIQPGRLQLQIRCEQPFWQLNTSLILDQQRLVAVAQRDIARGQRLQGPLIRFVDMNVAELPRGYISDDCQCDTWQAKRTIKQGSVVTPAMLQPATLIERGQAIMIHSQQPGMTVAMAGIAMSDGHLQQRIRVRNTSSDRVIWARVIAADRVQVP